MKHRNPTSHLLLPLLLVGSCIQLSTSIQSPSNRGVLQPWERHVDLNPFPSIGELEETVSLAQIDAVLDQVTSKDSGIIIQQYKPRPSFLWRQWFGTVIYDAWPRVLLNMFWASIFCVLVHYHTHGNFQVFNIADIGNNPSALVSVFSIANKLWSTLMSFTTFLLTFFVGQAYTYWKDFLSVGRSMQGCFNTIAMLLASHAARDPKTGRYTPEAEFFLRDIEKRLRLFHLLHWASQARRFRILLTEQGWDRMVERGMVSQTERKRLQALDLSPTQRQVGVFQSINMALEKGLWDKQVISTTGNAVQKRIIDEVCKLRSTSSTIPDLAVERIPLAYVHIVTIMVDTFLMFTPIAKYADMGIFSVAMIGILTLFYHGLLILAKVFLDPLDNEDFCEGCVYLDLAVLLRESNGSADKWIEGAATFGQVH